MTRLSIIAGSLHGTFTLGQRIGGGLELRDSRFGPALHYREAEWLLKNEEGVELRERAARQRPAPVPS